MAGRQVIDADVAVIGAGYAGVNAVCSATRHLPNGARIAWIDSRYSLGGQWVDQYDYVTLHQPYETFTVAGHSWKKKWHWTHLATKQEILEYFEDCVQAAQKSSKVDILRLFGWTMTEYTSSAEAGSCEVVAVPVKSELSVLLVRANLLIMANYLNIKIKRPIIFTANDQVQSTCPVDLLKPYMTEMIEESDKPIYVIGSGKTALDTINLLSNRFGVGSRLHCICGHGTIFLNRDHLWPPKFLERHRHKPTYLDNTVKGIMSYDGTNREAVLRNWARSGFVHTPIKGSSVYMGALASVDEVATMREALTPASDKAIMGHLADIIMKEGRVLLQIRKLDGKTFVEKEIPAGAILVNCTDHLGGVGMEWDPVVSEDGLVISPQVLLGPTGPSAAYCTHMHFLGKLDAVWRDIPRINVNLQDKSQFGIDFLMVTFVLSTITLTKMPLKYLLIMAPKSNIHPLHRILPALVRLQLKQKKVEEHIRKMVPARWTDPCTTRWVPPSIIGGNIGAVE